MPTIYTIGYEGKNIEQFLYELQAAKIKQLIDVRQIALSRKKGFSKRQLEANLATINVTYKHYSELGSPADARHQVRKDGNWSKLFAATKKMYKNKDSQEALNELQALAKKKRTAYMCFCNRPQACHRRVISEMLEKKGWKINHL